MMRRNKFKKIMTVLMASAALATAGFAAVACGDDDIGAGGGGGGGCNHNWKPNWSTTEHWTYCTECDEQTAKEPHIDVSTKDGLCDVCGATMPSSGGDNQGGDNQGGDNQGGDNQGGDNQGGDNQGGSGDTTPTGVFTITLNANGGTLGSDSTVTTSGGKLANLPTAPTAPANKEFAGWYSAATGGTRITTNTVFESNTTIYAQWKDSAAGEETTGKNEYTIYLYAPEATGGSIITISVWGGMAGAFSDGATMSTVTGSTGWYSFKFKTDKDIADGANFNLYVDDEQVATGYTTDASWVYFASGQNDIKWNSMAAAEDAYNESQNPGGEDVETETTTVYFHKPSDWEGSYIGVHAYYGAADKVVTGGWGETHMTVDSGDWYKVEIELPEDTANFNIIVFDENDTNDAQIRKSLNVTTGIGSNVYINAKGKAFTDKATAEADEDDSIPKAHTYTIYMYAPDASSVTIGVWGNFAGEIGDGTVMTAVAGHDGWYSYTLNTDIELKDGNGINLNIFVDGENKGKYSESDDALYFIPVGGDRGFADFETAEVKYEELTNVDPNDTVDVAIHFQAPTDWTLTGALGLHGWSDDGGDLTGGWGSTTMTAESDGWYTVSVTVQSSLIGTSMNFIFFDVNNNNESTGAGRVTGSLTLTATGVWVSNTGTTVDNPNA